MPSLGLLTVELPDVSPQNLSDVWRETYKHIDHQRPYQHCEPVGKWTISSANSKWMARRQWFLCQSLFLLSLCVNASPETIEFRARVQVLIDRYKRQAVLSFFATTHEPIVDDHEEKALYSDILYRIQAANVVGEMQVSQH